MVALTFIDDLTPPDVSAQTYATESSYGTRLILNYSSSILTLEELLMRLEQSSSSNISKDVTLQDDAPPLIF
jgi:hypothetical protein